MSKYNFKSNEECAEVVGKALKLPYTAQAYDYWSYQMFLDDLNNGRGDEWVDAVEENIGDEKLIQAFKDYVGYKPDITYCVVDLNDGETYGEFDTYEEAEEFIDNDQGDHNLKIREYDNYNDEWLD